MSCDQDLDKLSEKLNSRLLVQEEHGFQKGAQCAPWPQEQKKCLAWIGLTRYRPGFFGAPVARGHIVPHFENHVPLELTAYG